MAITLDRVLHRVKLRDLRLLDTVVRCRSMAKAANQLNLTQPAVSKAINELEQTIGARLLDRSRKGIEPTPCGLALLKRGIAIFDELRQGIKEIEFLSDPKAGEIKVGGNEPNIASLLPTVFNRIRARYPKISIHTSIVAVLSQQCNDLRERKVDLIIGRIPQSIPADIATEIIFYDRIIVVTGRQSLWSRRRKIGLSELANEPWGLPPPENFITPLIAEAFQNCGVEFPRNGVVTGSIHLNTALVGSPPFVAIFPSSMIRLGTNLPPLKVLPVSLPVPRWPIGIMTLKNRTQTQVVRLFIDCVREVVRPMAKEN